MPNVFFLGLPILTAENIIRKKVMGRDLEKTVYLKKLAHTIPIIMRFWERFLGFFFNVQVSFRTPKRAILGDFGGPLKNATFVIWGLGAAGNAISIEFFLYFAAKK